MFLFRKNIILVPTDYDGVSATKGLLSFDAYTGKTICSLKCYNLDIEKEVLMGIVIQKRLFKVKIQPNSSKNINFDIDYEIKSSDSLSAVLIDLKQDDYDILLWGSTEINNSWQTSLEMMIENEGIVSLNEQQPENNFEHMQTKFERNKENAEQAESQTENVEKMSFDKNLTDDVVLEEYIDKVIELSEEDDKQKTEQNFEEISKPSMPEFYQKIKPQIDKLFIDNEDEKILSEIIPNSKFCKVDFDDGTGYYVFGIIYEQGLPKYLCYGLPAKKDAQPPRELADFYQWLPVDQQNEDGNGFYLMYQDAETGNNISIEII